MDRLKQLQEWSIYEFGKVFFIEPDFRHNMVMEKIKDVIDTYKPKVVVKAGLGAGKIVLDLINNNKDITLVVVEPSLRIIEEFIKQMPQLVSSFNLLEKFSPEEISSDIITQRPDYMAAEKMVEKTANPITREADLKANGYKLTPALKKHMDRLDQLTGRKNTVKDIYKAYKTHDFHGDPEMEKTIKSIGKIFQRQEMQIKAVIPER